MSAVCSATYGAGREPLPAEQACVCGSGECARVHAGRYERERGARWGEVRRAEELEAGESAAVAQAADIVGQSGARKLRDEHTPARSCRGMCQVTHADRLSGRRHLAAATCWTAARLDAPGGLVRD